MIVMMDAILGFVVDKMWVFMVIPLILGLGLYFSVATGMVQIRYFGKMLGMLGEGFSHKGSDGKRLEGLSGFQAFAISIASRVGTGNLAGVAMAIALGGPGSIFWMWVMAFLGMASAFVESTLAQVYKVPTNKAGFFRGGPSYYLRDALNSKFLAIIFSIFMIITFGYVFNMIQVNTIADSFAETFQIKPIYSALGLAVLTGVILMGGVQRIAKVVGFFVPIMALGYIIIGLGIIMMNYQAIPQVFGMIFSDAFSGRAVGGGLVATIMYGLRRGLFSNEAGMGTAPAAAAAANTSHPVKQGLIQSLSVFTDTIVVCSITAFIILSSQVAIDSSASGIVIMQRALALRLGDASYYYLSLTIFIFAFSSLIGNYFYAESSLAYVTNDNARAQTIFKLTVIAIAYIGALAKSTFVWDLGDLFSGLMAIINLYGIYRLFPIARAVLHDFTVQMKQGKDPRFSKTSIKGIEQVACWQEE
jgi:alanine or glycine:cation symporter, AGCS family